MKNAEYWIGNLAMTPHKEGGYFKEMLMAEGELVTEHTTKRPYYTSIYFLLRSGNPSHFHRLKSDEVWYFHTGDPLNIHIIHPNGEYEIVRLGLNVEQGEVLQAVVPKGAIFGSDVAETADYSLVSCMVSPGFDYQDFELFTQRELLEEYPSHEQIIKKLAYEELPE